jgi:hypothetical protein
MAKTVLMLAPTGGGTIQATNNANIYVPDAQGFFLADPLDVNNLLRGGCSLASEGLGPRWLGRLLGANMNATTDQPFVMFLPPGAKWRPTKITCLNASTSLTTAVGGIYPAASKGGTALVANNQAYSALTAAALALDLTIVSATLPTVYAAGVVPILALTTAQGAAATADLYLEGQVYPAA